MLASNGYIHRELSVSLVITVYKLHWISTGSIEAAPCQLANRYMKRRLHNSSGCDGNVGTLQLSTNATKI